MKEIQSKFNSLNELKQMNDGTPQLVWIYVAPKGGLSRDIPL